MSYQTTKRHERNLNACDSVEEAAGLEKPTCCVTPTARRSGEGKAWRQLAVAARAGGGRAERAEHSGALGAAGFLSVPPWLRIISGLSEPPERSCQQRTLAPTMGSGQQ